MSDNNDLIREADRRHVIQLFDLFAESPYDALILIEAYSRTYSRIRADEGSEYHILKQPINLYNDILRENHLEITESEDDQIILHWMAELYVYTRYEKELYIPEKRMGKSSLYLRRKRICLNGNLLAPGDFSHSICNR